MRSLLAALLSVILAAGLSQAASANTICFVSDPTGTPLNVRDAPRGAVLGTLQNGVEVEIIATANDNRGRSWVRVRPPGATQVYGWVFRAYITC